MFRMPGFKIFTCFPVYCRGLPIRVAAPASVVAGLDGGIQSEILQPRRQRIDLFPVSDHLSRLASLQPSQIGPVRLSAGIEGARPLIGELGFLPLSKALVHDAEIVGQARGYAVRGERLLEVRTRFLPHSVFDAPERVFVYSLDVLLLAAGARRVQRLQLAIPLGVPASGGLASSCGTGAPRPLRR